MTRYEELPPRADAMIESMRAFGYDLPMAIADLIDNSIFAGAGNILIKYHWEGPESWIYILDDGRGMSEDELKNAMRLGSKSPVEDRDLKDLGRFGLGLKTASFSQCRAFSVFTKTNNSKISVRSWDLDHVEKSQKWEVDRVPPDNSERVLEEFNELPHGTLVFWQKLDRIVGTENEDVNDKSMRLFYEKFFTVKEYLEMVFHRYLSAPYNLKITLGVEELRPWDPYLSNNKFTQELAKESYNNGTVTIVPYVLPHISKRTDRENSVTAGPKGWNAQQGFYVYRNKRMIVSGGYLDLDIIPEDHYKLARIKVDIANHMDCEWSIDVRKAVARPPGWLRKDFERIARATRREAANIYRARTASSSSRRIEGTGKIWQQQRKGDKIVYTINKNNDVIKKIVEEMSVPPPLINSLFRVIETTVPHRLIIMDNAESEDCHVNLSPELNKPTQELQDLCIFFYQRFRKNGNSHELAIDLVLAMEPFNTHIVYRVLLEGLQEGFDNEQRA